MEIEYTLQAKEDLDFWKKSGNASILKKIRKMIEAITAFASRVLLSRETGLFPV